MPLIPTLQADVNAPLRANEGYRPALDRSQRPNVSSGQIEQGIGRLVKANMPDTVNPEPFVSTAGTAAKAIGQGIGIIGQVAEERIKAREQKAVMEAEAELDIASESLSTFFAKNRTNTSAWVPEAQRVTGEILGKWKDDPRLTREGRERLKLRLDTWAKTTVIHADSQGASADFQETRAAFNESFRGKLRLGDVAGAASIYGEASQSPLFLPSEKVGMEMDLKVAQQHDQIRQLNNEVTRLGAAGDFSAARELVTTAEPPVGMPLDQWQRAKDDSLLAIQTNESEQVAKMLILQDPKQLQEMLTKPESFPGLSPIRRAEIEQQALGARERAADMQSMEVLRSLNMLPPDKLETADVTKLGVEIDQLTPWHLRQIETEKALRLGKAKVDDQGRFEKDLAQIMAYDPAKLGETKAAIAETRTQQWIDSMYTGAMHKRLSEELDKRAAQKVDGPDIGPVMAELSALVSGPKEKPLTDAQGRQVYRDPKTLGKTAPQSETFFGIDWLNPDSTYDVVENEGQPVPITTKVETDPVQKAKDDALLSEVRREIEKAVRANPKMTQEEIRALGMRLIQKSGGTTPLGMPIPAAGEAGPNPLFDFGPQVDMDRLLDLTTK